MKKGMRFLLVFFILSGLSGAYAQTISTYFAQMPSEMLPTVPVNNRKDLVDFYTNKMAAVMPSPLGGKVVLKELSYDYLFLKTSDEGDFQLKLLPVNDTLSVIAWVQTVAAPLKSSIIRFYSKTWKLMPSIVFPTLTFLDFLDTDKGKSLGLTDRYNEVCLRNFISYKFNQTGFQVVAHSSIREDIRPEKLKDFEPVLKDSLTFEWNKGNFKLLNLEK